MQYLISLLIPLALFLLTRHRWSLLRTATVSVLLTYAVTVAVAFSISAWRSHQADAYDVNHDGVISLEEQSPEQSTALELAVNDAGRNLSLVLAAPWSALVAISFFGLVAAYRWVSRKRHHHPQSTALSQEGDA